MAIADIKTEYKDITIAYDEDTATWKFSFDDEDFASDSLKEAKASINKMLARDKGNLTPFKALYLKSLDSTSLLHPVMITSFSRNGRIYLKPEMVNSNMDVPAFIGANGYSDAIYPLDEKVDRAYESFKLAVSRLQKAEAAVRVLRDVFIEMKLTNEQIKVALSPKLKMREMKK